MTRYLSFIPIFIFFSACQDFPSAEKKLIQNIQQTGNSHHAYTDKEIDQLFVQLKAADDEQVIRDTQQSIRNLWNRHPDAQIDTLMQVGLQAMYSKDYKGAIDKFTRIIHMKPDYAEGWNKRATVFFMKGNFQRSLEDIRQTLLLERRHFGALSGKASIHMLRGDDEKALRTYERIHRLVPQLTEVNSSIQELRNRLGYRRI